MIPISVVMPTYNTPAEYLKEAVESILKQTFSDFEFIIIDDCSSLEESVQYLDTLEDPRVKILRNSENLGITKSLNIGLEEAVGKYIARMDSDDISFPERLKKQYVFMETHPDAILCGTYVERFGDREGIRRCNTSDLEWFRISLLYGNYGPAHPSVMYRKDILLQHHLLYDERIRFSQDYMMFVNASRIGNVYCLEEVLLRYRVHKGQVSSAKAEEQRKCADFVLQEQLIHLLENTDIHSGEKHRRFVTSKTVSDESLQWFKGLITANDEKKVYDKEKFDLSIRNLIAGKIWASYRRYDPRLYVLMIKYLPASYIMGKIKKRAGKLIKQERK